MRRAEPVPLMSRLVTHTRLEPSPDLDSSGLGSRHPWTRGLEPSGTWIRLGSSRLELPRESSGLERTRAESSRQETRAESSGREPPRDSSLLEPACVVLFTSRLEATRTRVLSCQDASACYLFPLKQSSKNKILATLLDYSHFLVAFVLRL